MGGAGTSSNATGSSSAPTRPSGTSSTRKAPSPTGGTNIRVPASFTIGAGGALNPPAITSPAFVAIQLTFASSDGRSHTVVVHTPTPRVLVVPPGGRTSVRIAGVRQGHYAIAVDGAVKGTLISGGEPGP